MDESGRDAQHDTWAWSDGRTGPLTEARVAAADRGLLHGDSVFETLPVVDGEPFALTRHLQRLRRGAHQVHLEVPWADSLIRSACAEVVGAAVAVRDLRSIERLRITVTPGSGDAVDGSTNRSSSAPTLLITVGPAPAAAGHATVVTSPWPLNEHSPTAGAKVGSRADHLMALHHARSHGGDEAMLVNLSGSLAEGTSSNVFLVVAGRLSTPSLSTGCLAGVTRGLVLECVEAVERDDLTIDDLRSATEAFLTSSIRGIQPISVVDGRPLRSVPGPLTRSAMTALSDLRDRTIDP